MIVPRWTGLVPNVLHRRGSALSKDKISASTIIIFIYLLFINWLILEENGR